MTRSEAKLLAELKRLKERADRQREELNQTRARTAAIRKRLADLRLVQSERDAGKG